MRRISENNEIEILSLKVNDYADLKAEILSLKTDVVRLTENKCNCSNPEKNITDLQNLRDEIKRSEQLFEQYKEDEALFKSSAFALINPRPIFSTLPPEAFAASSSSPLSYHEHEPSRSLLHKASAREDSCWTAKHNGPNSFIQVNLGQFYLINEIQTRGRGMHNQYIKSYKVGYFHHELNIEVTLHNLQDGNMFDGNYGENEIASNKDVLNRVSKDLPFNPALPNSSSRDVGSSKIRRESSKYIDYIASQKQSYLVQNEQSSRGNATTGFGIQNSIVSLGCNCGSITGQNKNLLLTKSTGCVKCKI
jgi:hypothetical protein